MIVQLILGALMIGSVYGVVGIGYGLIYKASGLMSLAQGDMLMLGAFLGLTFYKVLRIPFAIALFLTMGVMFLLGFLIERLLVTKLLKKGAQVVYIILCTIAISMLMQNGAMLTWGSYVLQFPPIFGVKSIKFGSISLVPESLMALGVAAIAMILLQIFMTKSKFGTSMRAAAQDEIAAGALGINVPLTKGVAWGLSAMLAGAVGVVVGPIFGVYTTMGAMIGQKAFAGAVIGGYGNMYGAIVGGLTVGFLETFVSAYISSAYKDVIVFAVLILAMVFMPRGIFNEEVIES